MLGLVTRCEPAARRPIGLEKIRGQYLARGESARRLSLFSGARLWAVPAGRGRQVFCMLSAVDGARVLAELQSSGHRVTVGPPRPAA